MNLLTIYFVAFLILPAPLWKCICPLIPFCFSLTEPTEGPPHSSNSDPHPDPSSLSCELDQEVLFYRGHTFAPSTTQTYVAQRQSFLQFCQKINIPPVPLSQEDLGRYIAYLSRRLTFSSVRQYLNAVRLLHLNAGHKNPLENNWYVASILKGVKRVKGSKSVQKLPTTLDILKMLVCKLDMSISFDRVFWTACIVAFYSFFRKSNLLVQSIGSFDPGRNLCTSDVEFQREGAVLTVRWSKVIKFRERTLRIPLPKLKNPLFCPSTALLGLCLTCPSVEGPAPLFRYIENGTPVPLTQAKFVCKLRQSLTDLGFPADQYSGHSFCRGGAQFALQCGLPVELIKLQGDWNSNAYERYLQPSFALRQKVASTMGSHTSGFLEPDYVNQVTDV